MTDEELLLAFHKDGDNIWLGYLLQRYTALLFGVALKYLKNREQAEDAVQHVFMKVLTHLPKDDIVNFKGWLYVLMRNYCLQQLRDKSYTTNEAALKYVPAGTIDGDDAKLQEYTLQQMNEAINELNDEQKKAITLFYLKKYSYEQIIEQTGFTFMQVKSYIQNGKRNLKNILLKKLGDSHK